MEVLIREHNQESKLNESQSESQDDSQNHKKLFIGGLNGATNKEKLTDYFERFGKVIEAFVVYDHGKPSGFGFVTVDSQATVDKILKQKHALDNSQIDVKPALDKQEAKQKELAERSRKIFVGGLPKNFKDEELEEHFSQFGKVHKCYVVKDPKTAKTRGFGFVIFSEMSGKEAALEHTEQKVNEHPIYVKNAEKRDVPNAPSEGQYQQNSNAEYHRPPSKVEISQTTKSELTSSEPKQGTHKRIQYNDPGSQREMNRHRGGYKGFNREEIVEPIDEEYSNYPSYGQYHKTDSSYYNGGYGHQGQEAYAPGYGYGAKVHGQYDYNRPYPQHQVHQPNYRYHNATINPQYQEYDMYHSTQRGMYQDYQDPRLGQQEKRYRNVQNEYPLVTNNKHQPRYEDPYRSYGGPEEGYPGNAYYPNYPYAEKHEPRGNPRGGERIGARAKAPYQAHEEYPYHAEARYQPGYGLQARNHNPEGGNQSSKGITAEPQGFPGQKSRPQFQSYQDLSPKRRPRNYLLHYPGQEEQGKLMDRVIMPLSQPILTREVPLYQLPHPPFFSERPFVPTMHQELHPEDQKMYSEDPFDENGDDHNLERVDGQLHEFEFDTMHRQDF